MWNLPIHIYGTTKQLTESGNYSNAGLWAEPKQCDITLLRESEQQIE